MLYFHIVTRELEFRWWLDFAGEGGRATVRPRHIEPVTRKLLGWSAGAR
jgi:hypothetical protein